MAKRPHVFGTNGIEVRNSEARGLDRLERLEPRLYRLTRIAKDSQGRVKVRRRERHFEDGPSRRTVRAYGLAARSSGSSRFFLALLRHFACSFRRQLTSS